MAGGFRFSQAEPLRRATLAGTLKTGRRAASMSIQKLCCVVASLSLLALASAGPAAAQSQDYPNRPVRWILGFAAGGPTDIVVRIIGQHLSEKLGQQFVIENRPGAGGNLATQAVVAAPPDGYTILAIAHVHAINATLYKQLPYNFIRDIEPVAGMVQMPNVMEVHPSLPVKSVAEFIGYAKANAGTLSYASAGNGTSAHLATELFKAMTGIQLLHVPYRGSGPALVDIMSGRVQVMFDTLSSSIPHIRDGKLRALAVTTATRSEALPDLPTVADTVPGFEVTAWFGVGAPKGTPPEIVSRLNREVGAALTDPKIKARFAELGAVPFVATPAEMVRHVATETEKWGRAVSFSGATVD
jgi:tripartite-type tricarboxylate transporter receptor subunit TctC